MFSKLWERCKARKKEGVKVKSIEDLDGEEQLVEDGDGEREGQ